MSAASGPEGLARLAALAERSRTRVVQRSAEHAAAIVEKFGPPLPGEGEPDLDRGEHYGHRSHVCPRRNYYTCQCGAARGGWSFAVDPFEEGYWDEPDPCEVCAERGLRRDRLGVNFRTELGASTPGAATTPREEWEQKEGLHFGPGGSTHYSIPVEFPDPPDDWAAGLESPGWSVQPAGYLRVQDGKITEVHPDGTETEIPRTANP